MRRLALCLALAVAALVAVSAAAAAGGPLYTVYGGAGVASHDGTLHFVAVPDRTGTLLERIDVASGQVLSWLPLESSWGIPALGSYSTAGEGLSRDGQTLVLAANAGPYGPVSSFLVVDVKKWRIRENVALRGSFSYDALSPDGSRLYLIEYAGAGDFNHYVVRAYDLRARRLLPGRIVDRKDDEKSMTGTPQTRTTSRDGRWVYTLYARPSGRPFVHALDTVAGIAHCIDLPPVPSKTGLVDTTLTLGNGGSTLGVRWRAGKPWLDISTVDWRISYPRAGFWWAWVGAGIGGGLALLAAGALLLRRRRGQKLQEHARQELGLA